MKNISWTVALLLLISASAQANADYKCTIKRISTAVTGSVQTRLIFGQVRDTASIESDFVDMFRG